MFVADGLWIFGLADRGIEPPTRVFSTSFASEGQTPPAEMRGKEVILELCQISNSADSKLVK
jgi:hypothetical protein